MKFSTSIVALSCTMVALLNPRPSMAAEGDNLVAPYGQQFHGEGTYYGNIPVGAGNCAMRGDLSAYGGMIPMAINGPQYDNSAMCGACIKGRGSGNGAGSDPIEGEFYGFVMDQCPECSTGDLDFAESGDGRWDIEWEFIPCPGSGEPTFTFEGSNPWYWKIQASSTISPAVECTVNGETRGVKTNDNFFIVEPSGGNPFYGEQRVEITTMLDGHYEKEVSL